MSNGWDSAKEAGPAELFAPVGATSADAVYQSAYADPPDLDPVASAFRAEPRLPELDDAADEPGPETVLGAASWGSDAPVDARPVATTIEPTSTSIFDVFRTDATATSESDVWLALLEEAADPSGDVAALSDWTYAVEVTGVSDINGDEGRSEGDVFSAPVDDPGPDAAIETPFFDAMWAA